MMSHRWTLVTLEVHAPVVTPPTYYSILSTQTVFIKPRFDFAHAKVWSIDLVSWCALNIFLPLWNSLRLRLHFASFVSSTNFTLKERYPHTTSLVPFVVDQIMHSHSAYQYVFNLTCLSTAMPIDFVQDPSPQFRMVMRVWRFLTATKRQGQAHGIDDYISHRRKGNLIVHCPCCLEPHVNMEPGWERTPPNLRYDFVVGLPLYVWNKSGIFSHLNQTQYTADGNHHSNKYSKNTDPDDISLYNGTAYFPEDTAYREFLSKIPNAASEVYWGFFNSWLIFNCWHLLFW